MWLLVCPPFACGLLAGAVVPALPRAASVGGAVRWSGPLPARRCAAGGGRSPLGGVAVSGSVFRSVFLGVVSSAFLLVFSVLRGVLFRGWGGFFGGWGGFFGGWAACLLCCFFVSLSRVRVLLLGFLPVPLGLGRGCCVRVLAGLRLVRACGLAYPRVAVSSVLGSRGGCQPSVRFLALRSVGVFLVGRLGGRLPLRLACRGLGSLGWGLFGLRSALALFLSFFNICLRCGSMPQPQ